MPLSQSHAIAFNAINNFVTALGHEFGTKQHSLALYARLIAHTQFSHEIAITKHIDIFTKYISVNQAAIEESCEQKLNDDNICYSERVFISLKTLFRMADPDTKSVMWKHLLTIYGILYPDSQAKEILRKINTAVKTPESDMVQSMIEKIAPHLNPDETNPMQAIMGLMSSGVFTELIGTMQKGMDNGTLDIQSMLGSANKLLSADPTNKLIDPKK